MSLVEKNFGCNILGRAADSVGTLGDHFGEAIVDEFEIAIVANHDILGLEVAVTDVSRVEILENACNLGAVQGGVLSVEVTHCAMVSEQITSAEQLRSKVNVTIVLEKAVITELWVTRKTEEGELLKDMRATVAGGLTPNGWSILARMFFSFSI